MANRPVYAAVGVTVDGHEDTLGLWMGAGGEGAKFWMRVLVDLKSRGIRNVFFVGCDGLKGLPEVVGNAWSQTIVQTCIVHLIRGYLPTRVPVGLGCNQAGHQADLHRAVPRRRVRRGDALEVAAGRLFDVIVANPPYVRPTPPDRDRSRAWDAGREGRAIVDRVTALARLLLAPSGMVLIVHSHLCGVDRTLHWLGGVLKASVVARHIEPFGPVLRGRVALREDDGLIDVGQRHEELVVIRGDRFERAA